MSVRTGLDRLVAGEGPDLRGKPIALLCHPASVDRTLRHAAELMRAPIGAKLEALLGPEHGLDAAAQDMETVADQTAARTVDGVPVHSLYGDTFESLIPTPDMFHGAEWLVCDLQDVGARYYTYVWTVLLAAEVALAAGLCVLLLDRPNPIGGLDGWVEGGAIEEGQESFVGLHDVSVRHGMTLAEIVEMALVERGRGSLERLEILECAGWRRSMLFGETGLPWVLPSPNMPTLETALVYPGQCLLEGTNVSEGRGTTRPFEIFGAPWLDGRALAERLPPELAPGLGVRPIGFKPMFQKHGTRACGGVQLHVLEPRAVRSLTTSWAILKALYELGASEGSFAWRTERYEFVDDRPAVDLLAGGAWLREAIEAGASVEALQAREAPGRARFIERRRRFLRYED